jgi:hypothetical protein
MLKLLIFSGYIGYKLLKPLYSGAAGVFMDGYIRDSGERILVAPITNPEKQ